MDVSITDSSRASTPYSGTLNHPAPHVFAQAPFFYFIHDRASETILFMGHVANPTVTADG